MIYQKIDFNSFREAFIKHGREAQFSASGLRRLFDYLEDLSNDTGQGIELDVIALCCEYSELSLDVLKVDFYRELAEYLTDDEIEESTITELVTILDKEFTFINVDSANDTVLTLTY